MRYSIRTVTPLDEVPTVITVAEAKSHLRVENDDEDELILAYLAAAQDAVERYTAQVLTEREMEIALSAFPISCRSGAIVIPRDPVTDILEIAYTDTDGASALIDMEGWRWSDSAPDMVWPAYSTNWPSAYDEPGSVRLTFQAGYEDGLCPGSLVTAVKLQTAFLYGNRGDAGGGLAAGVEAICSPYRRISL